MRDCSRLLVVCFAVAALVVGCGGDEESSESSTSPVQPNRDFRDMNDLADAIKDEVEGGGTAVSVRSVQCSEVGPDLNEDLAAVCNVAFSDYSQAPSRVVISADGTRASSTRGLFRQRPLRLESRIP